MVTAASTTLATTTAATTQQLVVPNTPLIEDLQAEDLGTFRKVALVFARAADFGPLLVRRIHRQYKRKVPHSELVSGVLTGIYLFLLAAFCVMGSWGIMGPERPVDKSVLVESFSFVLSSAFVGAGLLLFILLTCDGAFGHCHEKLRKRYEIPGAVDFAGAEESICRKASSIRSDNLQKLDDFVQQAQAKKNWAEYVVSVLSLGKSTLSPSPMTEYKKKIRTASREEAQDIIKEMQKEYDKAIREITDLSELWDGALGELVSIELSYPAHMEQMKRVADRFDIEIMLDTYYAGVPVEDIVA